MEENTERRKKGIRDFKLTTLALFNKSTVYVLAFVVFVGGVIAYNSLPKELFPDVYIPTIMVQTDRKSVV